MTRPLRVLVALAALALAPAVRAAEADVEQARALFQAGAQAYEKGEYAAALEAFEAAYRVSRRPGILFSIAQAHRRQYHVDGSRAHLEAAVRHYRDYLAAVTEGGRRAEAVQALAELELLAARLPAAPSASAAQAPAAGPKATRIIVSTEAEGARIAIDGGARHESPFVANVTPGPHRIRVTADGYETVERQVVAIEGEIMGFDLSPRELPARLRVTGAPGVEVAVDGRPVGRTPMALPAEITAGRHVIAATERGHRPRQFELTVRRGELRVLPVRLEPTGQRIAAYVLFGVSGVGLVAGGFSTTLALVREGDAESIDAERRRRNVSGRRLEAYADAVDARDAWRTAAWASFGAAAAAAAGGAVLFFVDHPEPDRSLETDRTPERAPAPRRMEISWVPRLAPGLAGAALTGQF